MFPDSLSSPGRNISETVPSIPLPTNRHFNILIPSLVMGGAERIVCDTIGALGDNRITVNLLLLWNRQPSYSVESLKNIQIIQLEELKRDYKLRAIALEVLSSPTKIIYTHLIRVKDLSYLWQEGIITIPVIHNSRQGWIDPPSDYDRPQVPFIVSCCDAVSEQIRTSDCTKPVITIRHEIGRSIDPQKNSQYRSEIRRKYNISEETFLIGMVGQFKPQKAYVRAVEVLHQLRSYFPAKLMIIGGWDNRVCQAEYQLVCRRSQELGIEQDLILAGNITKIESYYSAFDVYLNTSHYEGLSIATLEAQSQGCPAIVTDVGGQKEIILDSDRLVSNPSDINSYVEKIEKIAVKRGGERVVPKKNKSNLIPQIWCLLSEYSIPDDWSSRLKGGTLFVINNLNLAGAQRSLTNLLSHSDFNLRACVCTLDESLSDVHIDCLNRAGIPVMTVAPDKNLVNRAEKILHILRTRGVSNLCFWNASPQLKLLLSKILSVTPIRIVDVSPGSMYFDELETTADFQRRISWTVTQYFNRLDRLVVKYRDGLPPAWVGEIKTPVDIFPNGVGFPDEGDRSVQTEVESSEFLIGTCCRISPVKRLEWLIEMMQALTTKVSEVKLTIVGGVNPSEQSYWDAVMKKLAETGLNNIHFVGPVSNVYSYLRSFKVFVMVSEPGGCPNASLEAMSVGLPVVATRFGGALDQIRSGVNGFLVSRHDPVEMAECVEYLLRHPDEAKKMGQAGLRIVREEFSMEVMVSRYLTIFKENPSGG